MERTCAVYVATLPRRCLKTGTPRVSNPVVTMTVGIALFKSATARSKRSATSSGSLPGRMMSLPPAQKLTRSGASSLALGTCSSTIWSRSLPRTARLA